jgi:TrmH family RNA methyltransferase
VHPHVQRYLAAKRGRGEVGDLALEGRWAVELALASGVPVDAVFICPAMTAWRITPFIEVGEKTMRRMVDRDGPDGIAALGRLPSLTLDDVALDERCRIVVTDRVDLPGNLGTIIRCADGAGAAAVVVTDRRVRLTNPIVVKASMGTLFTMPVVDASRDDALAWLRASGVRVVAADPGASLSYRAADYRGPLAVVLGSERHGLAPFWRDHADVLVSIPMLGVADSLNVGHAAALLLYEALAKNS